MKPRILQHEIMGEGDPVVLVPGGLTGWLSWIPHQKRLSETRQAIRVQPIHNELGSRGEIPEITYDDVVERESLGVTLNELAIDEADLAGWSGGARALIEFSLEYPERVRTLTLIEPPAYWAAYQSGIEIDDETRIVEEFFQRVGGHAISEDDLVEFLRFAGFAAEGIDPRNLPQWERWVPHRQTLASQYLLGRKERTLAEISTFDRRVLLVKGTRSSTWLRGIVDVLGSHYPRGRILELEGTHACHIESIDTFLGAFEMHLSQPRTAVSE